MEPVCRLDDIAEGGCKSVELEDGLVLLYRLDDTIVAMDGTCPHQGGTLAEGAIGDGLVVCPLHHAVFELATGARRHGPGLGDLRQRSVWVERGEVLVGARPSAPALETVASSPDVVIVGAGAAGLACADALRRHGHDGPLTLIDAEDDPLYERTDLSKDVLAGAMEAEEDPRLDRAALERLGITLRFGETVAGIDKDNRRVNLESGEALGYDLCFAAPGAAARRIDLPGADAQGVFTLRRAGDARRLGQAAREAGSCTVIGGGFIGMEAAGALAAAGVEVTMIVRESLPGIGPLGTEVATLVADHLRKLGVTIETGETPERFIARDGRLESIRMRSGVVTPATVALLAVGEERHGDLVDGAESDGAVDVPASLRVAPGLWVGGDSAARLGERTRHWRAAEEDGRRAAAAMLGLPQPPEAVDFFWTKIGAPPAMLAFHMVGDTDPSRAAVDIGNIARGDFTRFFVEDDVVVGATGCGAQDTTAAFHLALMRDGCVLRRRLEEAGWDPARL
jgi:NADPH-dependent 2,4-dienoyl-CoA reductase/sulfur reductase-like enzyme/nitrite reductase/ring-hydroxylating ferredoxin subunit